MAVINGKIPTTLLSPIGDGRYLDILAANSWLRVVAHVKAVYGWTPTLSPGATAYRTYTQQVNLFKTNYTLTHTGIGPKGWDSNGDGVKETWWRRPGKATAATPGTSNHGLGIAIDVSGLGGFEGLRFRQFRYIASKHGWDNAEGASIDEPWHWRYRAANDTRPKVPGIDVPTVKPEPEKEPEMELTDKMGLANTEAGKLLGGTYVGSGITVEGALLKGISGYVYSRQAVEGIAEVRAEQAVQRALLTALSRGEAIDYAKIDASVSRVVAELKTAIEEGIQVDVDVNISQPE